MGDLACVTDQRELHIFLQENSFSGTFSCGAGQLVGIEMNRAVLGALNL